ncbi:MAG: SHOCT domain-containing protein, partial [Theionarchaea archaeon]|nr:SHOCT domain-containing protein [Theionarchaea archaeon]
RGEITLEEFESKKPIVEYDLNTLKVQLARGEITLEEFESRKKELEK